MSSPFGSLPRTTTVARRGKHARHSPTPWCTHQDYKPVSEVLLRATRQVLVVMECCRCGEQWRTYDRARYQRLLGEEVAA